jgi:hypothetical protein
MLNYSSSNLLCLVNHSIVQIILFTIFDFCYICNSFNNSIFEQKYYYMNIT